MDTERQKNNPFIPKIAIWCITPNGKKLGEKIKTDFKGAILFLPEKIAKVKPSDIHRFNFDTLSTEIHRRFNKFQGHVFIFSTGIAVRILSPLLKSKTIDPAVVVVDDNGTFAISLLSGHLGGANQLAEHIAASIHATPVITTATDTNDLPSIDLIAKDNAIFIQTPENIKHINMAILTGEPIDLHDPYKFIKPRLPKSFWHESRPSNLSLPGIFCSPEIQSVPRGTLILRPPVLTVGIGCNRGTSLKQIRAFLFDVLKDERLSARSIHQLATTKVKEDEKGLLSLAEQMDIPLVFYSNEDLNSVKNIQTPSKIVEKHLGVKSVCEAAAILSSNNGNLIVTKRKNKDVTIAVAIKR